jgi:hypothetical protein
MTSVKLEFTTKSCKFKKKGGIDLCGEIMKCLRETMTFEL